MGFYENDRIRNKNLSYNHLVINDIHLKLNNVSINDIIELLINNGYLVELKSDHTISIDRKST